MNSATGAPALPLFNWLANRSAGLLLHPTALPSDQGVGVLDGAIDALFAFMQAAGLKYWQTCPLGPTGYGDSPYQCFSAFAGNPYLVDLHALVRAGLLTAGDVAPLRSLPGNRVDYGALYGTKWTILRRAYDAYTRLKTPAAPYGDFSGFQQTHQDWLQSYALFRALKDHFKGQPWWEWPEAVRFHRNAVKSPLAKSLAAEAGAHAFYQYLFFTQWAEARAKARAAGIEIIGDAPIFVARDSADVWTNPELFLLEPKTGKPLVVAGVPPDYFSADGQLWGNPLYDWKAHAAEDYAWWLRRLRADFLLSDIVRIDHFRGFDTYWAIPASAPTARTGRWEPGPGVDFFKRIRTALPACRLIAEDLGELTPSVVALREATGLPGMAILQFAFGGDATNLYLPHNQRANCVVYPGSHDNDTTLGWYATAPEKARDHVRRYFRVDGREVGWDFLRSAYAGVCNLAVIPLQDMLSLGGEGRFNTPGKPDGNWQWRCPAGSLERLHRESAAYLRALGELYGRTNPSATV
ncbi:MAG TPA: 4-alpha-glucanotransferase [Opitutaceae bacterium]